MGFMNQIQTRVGIHEGEPEVACGIMNRGPEHGREIQELDGPDISYGIQELSRRKRLVVEFTNQGPESETGPENGYGIQELDSPEVGMEFTNQIQRKVGGFTNKNPERLVVEFKDLTTLVELKSRGQQRLVVEFPNQSPDVGCGIPEPDSKDPSWNLRTEADRDLLWNSRTGNPENPAAQGWWWILRTEEATALLWNSRAGNPESSNFMNSTTGCLRNEQGKVTMFAREREIQPAAPSFQRVDTQFVHRQASF
ncbi:hypothetical protein B0H13DRAFT_1922685 [Mycena leptocephala]|nr:hypothetical protein B0H13DRAFT_1922685 [Mycena leptocephala]